MHHFRKKNLGGSRFFWVFFCLLDYFVVVAFLCFVSLCFCFYITTSMSLAAVWVEVFWCMILTPSRIARGISSVDFSFLVESHKVTLTTGFFGHRQLWETAKEGSILTPGSEAVHLARCVADVSHPSSLVLHIPHLKMRLFIWTFTNRKRLSELLILPSGNTMRIQKEGDGVVLAWKDFQDALTTVNGKRASHKTKTDEMFPFIQKANSS